MDEKHLLINRLKDYGKTGMYPFHMPGHKRLAGIPEMEKEGSGFDFPNPFSVDITEIEGFDNLHHPEGILKESMEWAAGVYGADRTWYLVNGSSCGILSAISAVAGGMAARSGPGAGGKGKILMARNCHKAAYHGAYLSGLEVSYIYPQFVSELGIQGGILPEDVEKTLEMEPESQAVLLVSPTYDGVVSDIEKIAEIVHKRKIPLIVDEAHGAHFPFGKEFPVSALELGADVVIQSVHKTLPSMTQSAVLHWKRNESSGGPFVNEGRLERFLSIYQSSSPSYLLMASIENAVFQMERERANRGRENSRLDDYERRLKRLRRGLSSMKNLHLGGGAFGESLKGRRGIYDLDLSKIVISSKGTGWTGPRLDDLLRREYGLEMELCGADYVLGITTCFDSEEGFLRLEKALTELDDRLGWEMESGRQKMKEGEQKMEQGTQETKERKNLVSVPGNLWSGTSLPKAKICLSLREGMDGACRRILFSEAKGSISGEFVYVYPPGIPILAPGEEVTDPILETILEYQRRGLPVQGPQDHSLQYLKVIDRTETK